MSIFGAIISLAAAALLLAIVVWGLWRSPRQNSPFFYASLVLTAILLLLDLSALSTSKGCNSLWKNISIYAEALIPPIWLLCCLNYARKEDSWKTAGLLIRSITLLSFLLLLVPAALPSNLIFYGPDFPAEPVLFLQVPGYFFYVSIMAYQVLALIQLERTLTSSSPQALCRIRFDIIGLALIIVVQIFYYSQALLYRSINMNYTQLRSLMCLVAGLMIAYSYMSWNGVVKIALSRQMAFKSVTLFMVGLYLLVLSFMGEGMKYLSGEFSRSAGVSLAFMSGIGLVLILLSDRVRREIRVVLHKHFYQNKHDYRTEWQRFTEQLASAKGDKVMQPVLHAYCDTFGISGASMFLFDELRGRYCEAAGYHKNMAHESILPSNSLVTFMKKLDWVFFIKDDNPEILEENWRLLCEHEITLVVPLFWDDRLEGFIMLGRMVKPDETYIYEDFDLMKTFARQAAQTLRHQRLSRQLLQTREEAAIGNMATFVMHDLKNQLATLSMILENAPRRISNPEFQTDILESLGNTVSRMQTLIGRLKNLGEKELLNLQRIDILALLKNTAILLPDKQISISGTKEYAMVDAEEIQKVFLNLLLNAMEASSPDSPIVGTVGAVDGSIFVRIIDSGSGMTQEFIETGLFTPFKTTKPQGMGIGLYQCRQIVETHGGRIDVESQPSAGSKFTLWLPATDSGIAAPLEQEASAERS